MVAGGVRVGIGLLPGIEGSNGGDHGYLAIDGNRCIVDGLVGLQQALVADAGDPVLPVATYCKEYKSIITV